MGTPLCSEETPPHTVARSEGAMPRTAAGRREGEGSGERESGTLPHRGLRTPAAVPRHGCYVHHLDPKTPGATHGTTRSPSTIPREKRKAPSSNTHRFLAAPKPPGKMAASWLAARSWARSVILPRAILADSVRTFLGKSTERRTAGSVRDGRSSGVEPRRLSGPGEGCSHVTVRSLCGKSKEHGDEKLCAKGLWNLPIGTAEPTPPAAVRGQQEDRTPSV